MIIDRIFAAITTSMILAGCSASSGIESTSSILDGCEVVAERAVTADGDTLVTLPVNRLDREDVRRIPLSALVEPLEIIQLQAPGRDAYCGLGPIWISDNHIVTMEGTRNAPARLFRRDGSFVGSLGQIGEGPGEYRYTIDDCHIDERGDRVYIYPMLSPSILVFDLQARYIGSIPLVNRALQYIRFHVSPDGNDIAVLRYSPLQGLNEKESHANIWHLDSVGNISRESVAEELVKRQDKDYGYLQVISRDDHGMTLFTNTDKGNHNMMYRFDSTTDRLSPMFTVDLESPTQYAVLSSTPRYYLARYWDKEWSGNPEDRIKIAIVDKTTLQATHCDIYNDMLGGVDLSVWDPPQGLFHELSDNNSYGFGCMYDPGDLLDKIEERLDDGSISDKDRDYLTGLQEKISPDDNNVIILGRFRR